MNLKRILLEGRKDEFLSKYRSKFTGEELKNIFLLSRDLSSNHKFLMFLGDVLESGNIDYQETKDIIEKFIKYQKVLPTNDIYLFKSLGAIQDEVNSHENKIRRNVKEIEGADQIYEDNRFVVVTPKTHKASCYYGSGTKWCTTSFNGDSHFDRYNQDGKLFYIIDKTAKTSDRFYKVALLNKYDGEQTFYDAPDKVFTNQWILDTEYWSKINNEIQEYLQSNYEREINLFKDKEAARLELERIRKQQQKERNRRRLLQQEERKENDDWNIENDTEESNFANAVFKVMVDNYGVEVLEEEGESIYNLLPGEHSHYNLATFEWLGENDSGMMFAVGEWEQVYEAAKEHVRSLWDDIGVNLFSQGIIENHIDVTQVVSLFEEIFESDVEENPDVYFNEDDLPLSDKQMEKIKNLEEELDSLHNFIDNTEDTDGVDEAMERIEDIEFEIDEIKDAPEGEPTYEMIQNVVNNLIRDVRDNPVRYLREYGFEIDSFIDVDSLITDVVDMDGTGPSLSSYDGSENDVRINSAWYYVYRIE